MPISSHRSSSRSTSCTLPRFPVVLQECRVLMLCCGSARFAKQNVRPKLHNMDQDKITDLYTALRRESQATGSIPITARMVDAIIRLSEAHARLHLRDYVRDDDVSMAIRVVVTSFVETQKFSISKQMQRSFSK